jgi:hypothetical protein
VRTPTAAEQTLSETSIGKLFIDYERKTQAAWAYDGKIGAEDMPTAAQLKKARELWDRADTARETYLNALDRVRCARMRPDSSYWADGVVNVVKELFTQCWKQ